MLDFENLRHLKIKEFQLFTSVFGVSFINCLPSAKDLLTGIVVLSRFMELNETQLAEMTDEDHLILSLVYGTKEGKIK